jgi:prepilin-type N-terminal cleavage/methylation domain-containing protein
MKKLMKNKNGFTLIEVMFTLAILAIMGVTASKMYMNGINMWNSGVAQLQVQGEARLAMMSVTKFVHLAQGGTIKITRYNTSQPVNSCIKGKLAETAYFTSDQPATNCACTDSTVTNAMAGDAGQDFMFVQINNNLYYAAPNPVTTTSNQPVVYDRIKLADNLDFINFAYDDSTEGSTVLVSARFSKRVYANKPVVSLFLKKAIVIKHYHSAGFYAN